MSYTPQDVMDNLAWQWRDHHNDMFQAISLRDHNNGFRIIYDHQGHNPPVQGMYVDYVNRNGLNSFFELVISSAYPDHPSDLNDTKAGVNWMKSNCADLFLLAEQSFIMRDNVQGMFRIFQCQNHNPSWEETCRATYRDDKKEFIALFVK